MNEIEAAFEAARKETDKWIARGPWRPHVHTADGVHEAWAVRLDPVGGELEGRYVEAWKARSAARTLAMTLNIAAAASKTES